MTPEDKQLLLKDLCGRLPYGVKGLAYVFGDPCNINTNINGVINERIITDYESYMLELINLSSKDVTIKPYLRPMSSMTEEEVKEFYDVECMDAKVGYIKPSLNWHFTINGIDWLNARHFDYRGLIEKDLAIEVTDENNPYK